VTNICNTLATGKDLKPKQNQEGLVRTAGVWRVVVSISRHGQRILPTVDERSRHIQ